MDGDSYTTAEQPTGEALRLHRQLTRIRQHGHVAGPSAFSSEQCSTAVEQQDRVSPGMCWCISKGMAGMNSQTSGLARAAGFDFEFRDAKMAFPWNCLPLQMVPRSPRVLRNPEVLGGEPPRLIVSCGRHGILPALTMKKLHGDRVFTVHIQDPKIDTSQFDLVVIPKHDFTRGDNVYLTTGALHYVSPERLAAARTAPEANGLCVEGRATVAVLLGGPNGCYAFSNTDIDRLINQLRRLVAHHDVRLVILKSRRTPQAAADRLVREFGNGHYVWNGSGANPYFSALALADYVVVTGDSVSMVTEATATGRPVFVFQLTEKRAARRFRRFHDMFQADGLTRPFEGRLADWNYQTPDDTPRVAHLIRERMGIQ